jgi:hypothetical protein
MLKIGNVGATLVVAPVRAPYLPRGDHKGRPYSGQNGVVM